MSSTHHPTLRLRRLLTASRSYVPYTEEKAGITSCGIPQNYNASKEVADKKVVLFAVPGTGLTSVLSFARLLLLRGALHDLFSTAWLIVR